MNNLIHSLALALLALSASVTARADMPAGHGMLIFGQGATTYASHLPMFHAPHDYQVLLKVAFQDLPSAPGVVAAYTQAHAQSAEIFTILPETMDLTKVISGAKAAFTAKVFQGHFERGGKKIGALKVLVEKVVYSAKLNPQAGDSQSYLVFGEKGQYFAAHLIGGKPNHDSIVQVSQPYGLTIPSCRGRICADPVKIPVADAQLPLNVLGPSADQTLPEVGEALGALNGTLADVQTVIYTESGELAD